MTRSTNLLAGIKHSHSKRLGAQGLTAGKVRFRRLVGCVAVVFLSALAIVVWGRIENGAAPVQVEVSKISGDETILIPVLAKSISSNTKVTGEAIRMIPWPAEQVPKDAVLELQGVLGKYAAVDLPAGLPLEEKNFRNTAPAARLPVSPGMRAVSLTIDERTGVEGYAVAGTRVDVVMTFVDKGGLLQSQVLVQNARVLSYGGDVSGASQSRRSADLEGKREGPSSVTLEVSAEDALKIITAKAYTLIGLILRAGEDGRLAGETMSTSNMILDASEGASLESLQSSAPKILYCPSEPGSTMPVGSRINPPRDYAPGPQMPIFDGCHGGEANCGPPEGGNDI